MLRQLDAIQFICPIGSGKTDPSIVVGESMDGEPIEVVLKLAGMCERKANGLAAEVIAACLAGQLGLPVPEPFIVLLSPEWKVALPRDQRGRYRSEDLAFGSRFLRPQWPAWCVANRLTDPMVATAAGVLAFDLFIENHDRGEANANCLVSGDQIRIIDHELAWTRLLFSEPPWIIGALQRYTQPGNHIFRRELLSRQVDRQALRRAWSTLRNDDIQAYGDAVPPEWRDVGFISRILTQIRDVRDKIDLCLDEFERVLT